MFLKKGLRDPSLICKLVMKNPRTFEEMLVIANKYALSEEATLDTRDQKKDNELGHSDQPNTSKSNDKTRKSNELTGSNDGAPLPAQVLYVGPTYACMCLHHRLRPPQSTSIVMPLATAVTPHVSKPHDYVNHMFMRP
jgi:hypothetical protein